MKKPLLILLLAELVFAIVLGQAGQLCSGATARAWSDWQRNPNAETRAAFEKEKRRGEMIRWAFSGVVFVTLFSATAVAFRFRKDGAPLSSNVPSTPSHPKADTGK